MWTPDSNRASCGPRRPETRGLNAAATVSPPRARTEKLLMAIPASPGCDRVWWKRGHQMLSQTLPSNGGRAGRGVYAMGLVLLSGMGSDVVRYCASIWLWPSDSLGGCSRHIASHHPSPASGLKAGGARTWRGLSQHPARDSVVDISPCRSCSSYSLHSGTYWLHRSAARHPAQSRRLC